MKFLFTARLVLATLTLAAGPIAPATASASASSETPRTLNVVGTDYHFALSTHTLLHAGLVALHFRNAGQSEHQAQIARLRPGATEQQFLADIRAGHETAAYGLVDFDGGANTIAPGQQQTTWSRLSAGRYLVICFDPGPGGTPHMLLGTIASLRVVGQMSDQAPKQVRGTIDAYSFGFSMPQHIDPYGIYRFSDTNDSDPHELAIIRLAPGKTVLDFADWVQNGMKTAPPGVFDDGAGAIEPHHSTWTRLNLRPRRLHRNLLRRRPGDRHATHHDGHDHPVPHRARPVMMTVSCFVRSRRHSRELLGLRSSRNHRQRRSRRRRRAQRPSPPDRPAAAATKTRAHPLTNALPAPATANVPVPSRRSRGPRKRFVNQWPVVSRHSAGLPEAGRERPQDRSQPFARLNLPTGQTSRTDRRDRPQARLNETCSPRNESEAIAQDEDPQLWGLLWTSLPGIVSQSVMSGTAYTFEGPDGRDFEQARLRRQSALMDLLTERVVHAAGISSGMRVLNLGSGGGDVAMLLARTVGPTGHVIGVERRGNRIGRGPPARSRNRQRDLCRERHRPV